VKKALVVGGILAATAAGGSPASASASPSFGGCQLAGNARFSSPLKANQPKPTVSPPNGIPPGNNLLGVDWGAPFGYTFDGDLSGCQSSDGSAPAAGRIYAGEPIDIGGASYAWPFATPQGTGGCTGSNTSGTAVVVWADNSVSVIDYSTTGALAAIGMDGNFRPGSFTFQSTATNPDGSPASTTTVPLRYGDDYVAGPLAFEPPDPTACNGAGVTAAAIQGALGDAYLQAG